MSQPPAAQSIARQGAADQPVPDFAHGKALEGLARVAAETRRLVLMAPQQPETVEGIHQFRVSTRRFRAVLEAFPECFPEAGRRRVRRAIRTAFRASGEVRNRDITLELIAPLDLAGQDIARAKLQSERQVAEKSLALILERWVAKDFVQRWRARLLPADQPSDALPPDPPETLAARARRVLPEFARAFFAAGRTAFESGDAETLHEFRIAAKKFRYSLELFAPLYGPKFRKKLSQLKQLQDLLGEMNDLATAHTLLRNEPGLDQLIQALSEQSTRNREALAEYWNNILSSEESAWVRYYGRILRPRLGKPPVSGADPPAV
jgi:CHAD domain-containing protein